MSRTHSTRFARSERLLTTSTAACRRSPTCSLGLRARSMRSRRTPSCRRSCARSRVGWNGFRRHHGRPALPRTGAATVLAGRLAPVGTRRYFRVSCRGGGGRRLRMGDTAVRGGTRGAAPTSPTRGRHRATDDDHEPGGEAAVRHPHAMECAGKEVTGQCCGASGAALSSCY